MKRQTTLFAAILSGLLLMAAALVPQTVMAQANVLDASGLVGKLEGPTVIRDSAMWPTKFNEAPELAALVKAGKLPPVE